MKKSILTLALGMVSLGCFALVNRLSDHKPIELSIKEAIEKGILELKISGAYDPRIYYEVLNADGVHFGKCVAIVLKSKIDSLVLLRLDCGTQLIPADTSVQTMIVTQKVIFPLYPNRSYATRFYAMCGQLHDKAPNIETTFRISGMADSGLVKLANYIGDNFTQNMIGQHAVWAFTDHVNSDELKKYGGDSISIAKTKDILYSLSLNTKLTPKIAAIVVVSPNDINLNRFVFYAGLGLLLIMITAPIILILKRKNNGNVIVKKIIPNK